MDKVAALKVMEAGYSMSGEPLRIAIEALRREVAAEAAQKPKGISLEEQEKNMEARLKAPLTSTYRAGTSPVRCVYCDHSLGVCCEEYRNERRATLQALRVLRERIVGPFKNELPFGHSFSITETREILELLGEGP